MVTTRRALLGAGALLLAGCGPPEEPEIVAADVWGDQLRASQAALRGYDGVAQARALVPRARSRMKRLEAAVQGAGGTVGALPEPPAAPGLEWTLAVERRALETHVAGIGLLLDRPSRELLANLIAETAEAESALLALLDRPVVETAFPGQPSAAA